MMKFLGGLGRAVVVAAAVLFGTLPINLVVADYLATVPGSGTTFAAKAISGANYVAFLLCDPVLGEATCGTVKAASTPPATTDTSIVVGTADGNNVTQGAKADSAATNSTSSWSVVAMLKGIYAQLGLILTQLQASIPAGTNVIGKVGIDQTTPGTTNGVQVNAALPAGTNVVGKAGIDQTTPGTTNGVVDAPVSASPTNVSASTSATPSTATTLLAASATHRKVVIKVEGTSVVCFSQFGAAVIGSAGTWCLKGASSTNAGDGGTYSTPVGMTEPNAISMISANASILVTAWWQ